MVEDGGTPEEPPKVATRWIVLVFLVLLALNVWLLWFLPDEPALKKAAFVLTLVGFYSLALNFSNNSGLAETFPDWLPDLTSPILRDFVAASFRVLGVAFLMGSLFVRGFPPPLVARGGVLGVLGVLLALPLAFAVVVAIFVAGAAYLVVIVPLAYLAYLLASVVLDSIEHSPQDMALSSEEGSLTMKGLVQEH